MSKNVKVKINYCDWPQGNMTPLYLLKIVFPQFDPLTVTGMALCVDHIPKCQNLFCLV
jgi:hypothetical protein